LTHSGPDHNVANNRSKHAVRGPQSRENMRIARALTLVFIATCFAEVLAAQDALRRTSVDTKGLVVVAPVRRDTTPPRCYDCHHQQLSGPLLYVIDGTTYRVPEDSARSFKTWSQLQAKDIQSIEIVTGEVAQQRYGSQGRPAIVITTKRSSDSAAVLVHGPTLIAFYPDATQTHVDSNPDLATTLDDFSYHLSTAADSLRALGITVVQHPAGVIDLIDAHGRRRLVPAKDSADVGYAFVAPGRRNQLYYGVMTNSDLIAKARAFLRSTVRR